MKYLVDTNILLRLVQKNSPMHLDTQRAILTLKKQGDFLCIIPQNIIEFWAVSTRPLDKNGLGLSITQAEEESEKLKKIFILELDTPQIFTEWESLVIKYQVMGKQVHDARLAAAMVAHNITHLLTFNVDDFKRFSDIVVVDPRSIV
ncbi:type II toxin-antitoxin system VapC family toxin [Dolichospermum sp. ST_sed1]|nr:type II toxin-antitoxin system VapC family toxin [Dolichospermum sp. ST_sed1]MDD1424958.1 type II toxin-antitoxin system VapC family toxin [Dolichospermum sp. ST_sed9]MDD1433348.1 type II toxin-antitoxin system VapC family toxin [Dolichospermum sp. ST_sed6]MDD1442646.1 type II toxin-antitoxin system VapC family toxin [Dolichospermum sp. ST_sed3]MDD1448321.1 type II toxin-antitoxin system VapC family toxin [Dolichospermum sp. ST_sed8]MDD1457838.1 type II toxin-antitoxin system VapC family to